MNSSPPLLMMLVLVLSLSSASSEVLPCLRVLDEALEAVLNTDGMPPLSDQPTSCEPELGVSQRMLDIADHADQLLLSVKKRWTAAFNSALIDCPTDEATATVLSKIREKLKEKVTYTGSEIRRGVIRTLDLIQRETYRDKGLSTDNQCITKWPNIAAIIKAKWEKYRTELVQIVQAS
eukprot:TRINITY_DN27679_c0_g1_i1.p1 TRINITY_DN27679_c0_g1~~TRINITY_DN27679_c0_g1_i1.p1  ORF type:complete len:178 (+),score=24.27 TRINITY_DN27679_c0_g1_i1:92-625(+)